MMLAAWIILPIAGLAFIMRGLGALLTYLADRPDRRATKATHDHWEARRVNDMAYIRRCIEETE